MFTRWIELHGQRSCLLVGPCRSGKTTLARERYRELRYVTLDDLDYLDWAERDPKGFIQDLGTSAIIDEVQRCPRLTIAVKHAIDQRAAFFVMTGSSTLGLLDSASDTLAGRIDIYSLPTACWGEEQGEPTHAIFSEQAHPLHIKEGNRLLRQAITFGQFPEVLTCQTEKERQETLIRYKNTYFTRDMMQLSNIEHMGGLLGILHNLAYSLGSHLEVSNFARESGISHPTAKKYLNVLDQAQLTFSLQGYQFGPAKRFLKATKTYFADNGIIHSLNIPLSQGALLENFVIAELEKRRKLGYIATDRFYYYKSAAGHEVDLIIETADTLYAIEIKATRKPGAKDITTLKNFSPQKEIDTKRFLFYGGDEYATADNVTLIPIAALFRGK